MDKGQKKIIAIGGGVGPMAGVELHKKIIENTNAGGTDQEHLEVHHLSRSHDIPDRTAFLLGKSRGNPASGMVRTARVLAAAAAAAGRGMVMGIPCNTFHVPRIWDDFTDQLNESGLQLKVLHMIAETAEHVKAYYPIARRVGMMSTTGTRDARLYHDPLEAAGYTICEVPVELQAELHDSIYNEEWGLKGVSPVSAKARANFLRYAEILTKQGAEVIILACTEIPLALPEKEIRGVPLLDAMTALARALIREAGAAKLLKL